jgi:hypothetical protein
MASSFWSIHSIVGYMRLLVKCFRIGQYADIHTDSGIHIQILVRQPENSGISGIPI